MNLPVRVLTAAVPSDPVLRADGGAVACVVTRADIVGNRWERRVRVGELESAGPSDRHPRWSPVGDELFFIRPDDRGVDQVVQWPDGDVVTAFDTPVRQFVWSTDGGSIAVVVTVPTSTAEPVVATGPTYLRDGEGRAPGAASLVVVDLATWTPRTVLEGQRSIGDVAWSSPDRLSVALPHDDHTWRWDLWSVALDATATPLTTHSAWERAAAPITWDEGSILYAGGESGPAHAELRVLRDGVSTRVFPGLDRNITIGMPAYPGARPVVDDGVVWCTANDRGVSRLWSGTIDADAPTAHTDANTVVTGVDARHGTVVLTEATSTAPGRLRTLHGPVWPEEEAEVPWTVEQLRGDVPGWLLRSRHAGADPAPVLVDLHGGPHNVSNGVLGQANLHRFALASAGWHVLLPNFRGSDGYGTAWYRGLEPSGGWCSIDVVDVLTAIDDAIDVGLAAPDRLAVAGYSYGGLLAAALTAGTDRFRAAALGGAPVDLRAFSQSSDMGLVLCEREVGEMDAADLRSPIRRVGDVHTPTLVFHGADDRRVPVSQADQWYQSLVHHGVECELAVYPGMSHGFVSAGPPNTILDLGTRIAAWLLQWNTP
jgi:dipeptidyl aminopeptidase/acylaminoacyl peptidase